MGTPNVHKLSFLPQNFSLSRLLDPLGFPYPHTTRLRRKDKRRGVPPAYAVDLLLPAWDNWLSPPSMAEITDDKAQWRISQPEEMVR